MRLSTNVERLQRFMRELGRHVRGSGRVYLTGGATAVLHGWRETTVDIDLSADPEPAGFFEGLSELKTALNLNLELARPSDFVPELPGWQNRSPFIVREGRLDFHHYDFYSQTLSKLERWHDRDQKDVASMVAAGLVKPQRLRELFVSATPQLLRYPAIDADALRQRVEELKD